MSQGSYKDVPQGNRWEHTKEIIGLGLQLKMEFGHTIPEEETIGCD